MIYNPWRQRRIIFAKTQILAYSSHSDYDTQTKASTRPCPEVQDFYRLQATQPNNSQYFFGRNSPIQISEVKFFCQVDLILEVLPLSD